MSPPRMGAFMGGALVGLERAIHHTLIAFKVSQLVLGFGCGFDDSQEC